MMRADGDGVKETKTHGAIFKRVVARRPNQSEAVTEVFSLYGIYELQKTAHGEQAYAEGIPASHRVSVQGATIPFRSGSDQLDVVAAVAGFDLLFQSGPGRQKLKKL
jgi:hypothetical protein